MDFLRRLGHGMDRRAVSRTRPDDGATFVETPHGTLRVQRRGAGPVVLLAPDPPNGLDHIEPLIAALAARYEVIAFEPPGFGWSTVSPAYDWSLDAMADVVGDLLDAHDVQRATLALPCLLGLVGLRFADRHPERVAGLVLSQTCAWPETRAWLDRIDKGRILRTPVVGQVAMRMQEPNVRDRWYRTAEADPADRLRYTRLADRRARAGARFPLASALQGLPRRDPFDGVTLDQPAVVLWGPRDRSHDTADAESLVRVLPRAEVQVVPNAGHFPDLTAPDSVVEAVDRVTANERATAAVPLTSRT